MTSTERIIEYINITPESMLEFPKEDRPPDNWPTSGDIVANGVSMKYTQGAPLAIDNISFNIRSREKVLYII